MFQKFFIFYYYTDFIYLFKTFMISYDFKIVIEVNYNYISHNNPLFVKFYAYFILVFQNR